MSRKPGRILFKSGKSNKKVIMYDHLLNGNGKLAVIGLGYVGLPIALEFAKKIDVIGFDISERRINMMKKGIDPSKELDEGAFEDARINFTADGKDLKEATFFIIAVPTPVDKHNIPELTPLLSASAAVGKSLDAGDYVVYESTVYPGCTEDDCIPALEQASGLTAVEDFKVGYSPERINPGDKEHTLARIVKVVSGCDTESLDVIAKVYELVVDAGVHKASSIKVAEAAKIIENTQRDVNIALMNELSKIFDKVGINTFDVLEAASTKWNFLNFYPGLVGGHCIGVDPYYLTYKSTELGYEPEVILSGRRINDNMPIYVAKKTIQHILNKGKHIRDAKVLILGATFKENVSDIRNSKIADLVSELMSFSVDTEIYDPLASSEEVEQEYGFKLIDHPEGKYDAIIMAVNHDKFDHFTENDFTEMSANGGIFIDVKGVFRNKIHNMTYWSL